MRSGVSLDLHTLVEEEDRLIALVEAQVGLMEEKEDALVRLGVFAQYAAVHEAYVSLAHEQNSLEALKRALFLQWFAVAEPACFSGLREIRKAPESRLWILIGEFLRADAADDELHLMLASYYALSDFYFDAAASQEVIASARAGRAFTDVRSTLVEDQFLDRGAMGEYWSSYLDASHRRDTRPS